MESTTLILDTSRRASTEATNNTFECWVVPVESDENSSDEIEVINNHATTDSFHPRLNVFDSSSWSNDETDTNSLGQNYDSFVENFDDHDFIQFDAQMRDNNSLSGNLGSREHTVQHQLLLPEYNNTSLHSDPNPFPPTLLIEHNINNTNHHHVEENTVNIANNNNNDIEMGHNNTGYDLNEDEATRNGADQNVISDEDEQSGNDANTIDDNIGDNGNDNTVVKDNDENEFKEVEETIDGIMYRRITSIDVLRASAEDNVVVNPVDVCVDVFDLSILGISKCFCLYFIFILLKLRVDWVRGC